MKVELRMKFPATILLSASLTLACTAKEPATPGKHPEKWYQDEAVKKIGGTTEHRVDNGRVDILTDTHAIEVEFAAKWKNAIGQSLWYSLQTNKPAGIILIVEDEKADRGQVIRLGSVISANHLPIKVWIWPDDFK
jgi:hypothetical protein